MALVLVVPNLLLGPALGSGLLLLHEHGHHELHGHAFQGAHSDETAAHGDWHDQQHAGAVHHPGQPHFDEKDTLPTEVLVERPAWSTTGSTVAAQPLELLRFLADAPIIGSIESRWADADRPRRPTGPSPGPPGGSGAARVLRASHALLI